MNSLWILYSSEAKTDNKTRRHEVILAHTECLKKNKMVILDRIIKDDPSKEVLFEQRSE